MAKFKSKITGIISQIKDYNLGILADEVEKGLDIFAVTKFLNQRKILTENEEEEVMIKRGKIVGARGLVELDNAIWDFEQFVRTLIDIKPGELEFAVATHLQSVLGRENDSLRELSLLLGEGETSTEGDKRGKEGGRVLPFHPEKGRH